MNSPNRRESGTDLHVALATTTTALLVEVGGEVDLSNHLDLHAALTTADLGEAGAICLDLHRLDFCDSSGAMLLLAFERKVRGMGRRATIRGAGSSTQKLLTLLAGSDPPQFE